MKPCVLISPDDLIQLLSNADLVKDVAEELGCDTPDIQRFCKRNGLQAPSMYLRTPRPPRARGKLVNDYLNGWPARNNPDTFFARWKAYFTARKFGFGGKAYP